MTFQQELHSWLSPSKVDVEHVPAIGAMAPSTTELQLPISNGKPTVVTFLRHCGCPFAEKTFRELRACADKHPDISFIAVSHSDQPSTNNWLQEVGGMINTEVIVDPERKIYGRWGLGVSSAWHVLNPWSMYSVWKLGKSDDIWNRPTESGNRWQTSGSFAIDAKGIVKWGGAASSADIIPDFEEALKSLGAE